MAEPAKNDETSDLTAHDWIWFLRSRKVQAAAVALAAVLLAKLGFHWDTETVASIVGLGIAVILGIAHEDAGAKGAPVITVSDAPADTAAPKSPTDF